jgi:hypothetical protein
VSRLLKSGLACFEANMFNFISVSYHEGQEDYKYFVKGHDSENAYLLDRFENESEALQEMERLCEIINRERGYVRG